MKPMLSVMKLKRLELRKTQQEVADYVGVTRPYINSIENNKNIPSAAVLEKLTEYFSCNKDELMCSDTKGGDSINDRFGSRQDVKEDYEELLKIKQTLEQVQQMLNRKMQQNMHHYTL